jgi:hypothetical protein
VRRHHEILGYLRGLKEIDTRWDVETWRRRIEFPPPAARADYATEFTRHRETLEKAAEGVKSPVLAHDLPELGRALDEKSDLFTRFGKAADASRQALQRVAGADTEMAGLVRGSWRDFPERERLVALEDAVMQLLMETHKYYLAPDDAQRANIDALAGDLRKAGGRFPPALKTGIDRLDKNVQDVLRTRLEEKTLSDRLALHAAGPRIDSLTRAFNGEVEQALVRRQLYAVYLSASAAALLTLLGYLLARLIIDRHRGTMANLASKEENPAPERRPDERGEESAPPRS